MARTRLTVDVDPQLRRQLRVAVATRDETIKDFLERAILRELGKLDTREGRKPADTYEGAPRLRSERTVAEAVIEDRR